MFATKHAAEFAFLEHFLVHEVPEHYDVNEKRVVFQYFIETFHQPQYTHEHRVQLLQKVVIPMVQHLLKRNEGAQFMPPVRPGKLEEGRVASCASSDSNAWWW